MPASPTPQLDATPPATLDVLNRWSGRVLFSCIPTAEIATKRLGLRLGFAVKVAVSSGANLRGANLRRADLRRADLSGANLSEADLSEADLSEADLSEADLSEADLSGADLSEANLRGAVGLPDAPVVPNIDAAILAAVEAGGTLRMSTWHTCGTSHCRGGWAVHLAGDAGYALERKVGTQTAATLIYAASRPNVPVPSFSGAADDDATLADIRACAAAQIGDVA